MNEQIINHLFGTELPPGMTRRVHTQPVHIRVVRTQGQRREPLLEPIVAYLKAHPWSTAKQVAAGTHKSGNQVNGMLCRHVVSKHFERRGKSGSFEYRIKEK